MRGIRGVFMGYTYVSGMCRVCIGYVSGKCRRGQGARGDYSNFVQEKINLQQQKQQKTIQTKNKEGGWLKRQHKQLFRFANIAQRQGDISAHG